MNGTIEYNKEIKSQENTNPNKSVVNVYFACNPESKSAFFMYLLAHRSWHKKWY